MEYWNTIWYPLLRKDIESVEKIQRRATKLIPELKDMTYTERLKKLKLPRRRRGDMIQTFKIISDPVYTDWSLTEIQSYVVEA